MPKPVLPKLRGRSVLLRPPRSEDAAARLALGVHPEIVRMYGGSSSDVRPMIAEVAERWVQRLMKHEYAWIIVVGSHIGHVRLDHVDLRDRRASLAIGIEDFSRLGKGMGTEAIRLVQQYAFGELGLHRLSVRVVDYNHRAIRAYEKCGFVIEGREREAALVDGRWYDDVMMGLLDRENRAWLSRRGTDQPPHSARSRPYICWVRGRSATNRRSRKRPSRWNPSRCARRAERTFSGSISASTRWVLRVVKQ
jgi:RimJ/RimL family protein N-acetyltransferase